MTEVDYQERYKECMNVLREIACGRYYGGFDSHRITRKGMMRRATELIEEFDAEDKFNQAVAAYVEQHYANAVPLPKVPSEC